jgi:hypothetical protein
VERDWRLRWAVGREQIRVVGRPAWRDPAGPSPKKHIQRCHAVMRK